MSLLFPEQYKEELKKAQLGYSFEGFVRIVIIASIISALAFSGFFLMIFLKQGWELTTRTPIGCGSPFKKGTNCCIPNGVNKVV